MKMFVKKWQRRLILAVIGSIAGMMLFTGCADGGEVKQTLEQTEKEKEKVMAAGQEDDKKEMNVQEEVKKETETQKETVSAATKEPEPEPVNIPADDYHAWNELFEENAYSEEFVQALEDFSYRSASMVLSQKEENGNFSPLSLYYALALAGSGAEKETAAELLQVLGMQDKEELALACRNLYRQIYYQGKKQEEFHQMYGEGDYQSAFRLRNSLWMSDAFPFCQEYQDRAAKDFYASLHQVDFKLPETGKRMGKWISEQTNGVLEPAFTVDPDTALCIINTLYYYGGWDIKFSKQKTKTEEFTLSDGTKIECPMMNRTEETGVFIKGDGYTMSQMDTNNQCKMVILLPDRDRSVMEFLQEEKLKENLGLCTDIESNSWHRGEVVWKLPRFSFGSSYSLEPVLQQMGAKRMFSCEDADFSGISPQKPLWVSQVIQESHIGVDEEGVEGAAYTMIAVCGTAGMVEPRERAEMICDRPFIYGIWDSSSRTWLFLGVCQNPV